MIDVCHNVRNNTGRIWKTAIIAQLLSTGSFHLNGKGMVYIPIEQLKSDE